MFRHLLSELDRLALRDIRGTSNDDLISRLESDFLVIIDARKSWKTNGH